MDRSSYPTKLTTLAAAGQDSDVSRVTPGERVTMVWQLTREAWTFKDDRGMNRDFAEMLDALSVAHAEFLDHRLGSGLQFSVCRRTLMASAASIRSAD